jgi:hypothetical protein
VSPRINLGTPLKGGRNAGPMNNADEIHPSTVTLGKTRLFHRRHEHGDSGTTASLETPGASSAILSTLEIAGAQGRSEVGR